MPSHGPKHWWFLKKQNKKAIPLHLQWAFLLQMVLFSTLAQSLCVGLPAHLSVQLSSFQPIRGLQDPPANDDDVRALVENDFLWSGVLLPQNISY